jgi:hypothetical protein
VLLYQNELNKIHQAIRALGIAVRQSNRKWHHTAVTKQKLALAQKRIWTRRQVWEVTLGRQIDLAGR